MMESLKKNINQNTQFFTLSSFVFFPLTEIIEQHSCLFQRTSSNFLCVYFFLRLIVFPLSLNLIKTKKKEENLSKMNWWWLMSVRRSSTRDYSWRGK